MNTTFEQGPPLPAVAMEAIANPGIDQTTPPVAPEAAKLNDVSAEAQQAELRALKSTLARVRAAQDILDSFKVDVYARGSSLVDTVNGLTKTYTPPCEVVMFPRGYHMAVKPHGSPKPMSFTVDESWAKLFAHNFERMKSAGSKPYFDFFHQAECGVSGWPNKIFWAPERGVCALVEWSPDAAKLILSGECNSFSPTWNHVGGNFPFGVGLIMGGLLLSSMQPALQRMPPVKPVLQNEAVKLLAKRFWQFLEARLPDFRESEFAIIEAMAAVAQDCPDAYRAYALRKAISDAVNLDVEAAYS